MARFHVSADGRARACNATKGNCPLKIDDGDGSPAHGDFNSPQEAQAWAEDVNARRHGDNALESISKNTTASRPAILNADNWSQLNEHVALSQSRYTYDGMDEEQRTAWENEADALGVSAHEPFSDNPGVPRNYVPTQAALDFPYTTSTEPDAPLTADELDELNEYVSLNQSMYSNDGMDVEGRVTWKFEAEALAVDAHEGNVYGVGENYAPTNRAFEILGRNSKGSNGSTKQPTLNDSLVTAAVEYAVAPNKNEWAEKKLDRLVDAHNALNRTLPGTPEREAAKESRMQARLDATAADIVMWRDSPFYNDSVEEKMKEKATIINDADKTVEAALADRTRLQKVAVDAGVSSRDVENILEMAHGDYLRPRSGLGTPIKSLGDNELYVSNAAHIFRLDPGTVSKIFKDALV